MKKIILLLTLFLGFALMSCGTDATNNIFTSTTTSSSSETITLDDTLTENINFEKAYYEDYTDDDYTTIDGSSTSYTITEEGTYVLTGTITQTIIIDVAEDDDVRLVLDNVTIDPSENGAILILSADDITISAPAGTTNYLSDSSSYSTEYADYTSVIYSVADVAINGTGTIEIDANNNNAIQTKDDLIIIDVTLDITSVDDGIIGRDSLLIDNATITIDADGDALKATNDETTEKGFIYIQSGIFDFTTGGDGFDSVNYIIVVDGDITIDADGKGLRTDTSIFITGGTIEINSTDDGMNANEGIEIDGGTITIYSKDDGIHADETILINGGSIDIETSYEGIESQTIEINGGTISITSTDDGINGTSATSSTSFFPSTSSSKTLLTINGGTIEVTSGGDSIDINGSIIMTDGVVYCYGPMDDNSAFDYDGTYTLSGGIIYGTGSSQMAQAPSTTSTQASIIYTSSSTLSAGKTVTLSDSNGDVIFQATLIKTANSIVISTPDLEVGSKYTLSITGLDDITFTLSSTVTSLGSSSSSSIFPSQPSRH